MRAIQVRFSDSLLKRFSLVFSFNLLLCYFHSECHLIVQDSCKSSSHMCSRILEGGQEKERGKEPPLSRASSPYEGFQKSLTALGMHSINQNLLICPALCDLMSCGPAGSSVHGNLQARMLGVGCPALLQGHPHPRVEMLSLCLFHWQEVLHHEHHLSVLYYILQHIYFIDSSLYLLILFPFLTPPFFPFPLSSISVSAFCVCDIHQFVLLFQIPHIRYIPHIQIPHIIIINLQVHSCCGKWQNFIPFYG